MNASTINDSTFIIHSLQTGLHSGIYSYDTETKTVTFNPDINFAVGEVVSVILTTAIEDVSGDTLASPFEWSFTIEVDEGLGEFAEKEDYVAGNSPHSVFSSDLDSDGYMDLVVANYSSSTISVLLNNGDGTFAGKVDYSTGTGPWSVFSSDLDNDGDMDLAVANDGSDNASVLLNINPFITVTSPNGGEEWEVDSDHAITWISIGTSEAVSLEYSTNNGSDWKEIIESTPDVGTYSWTIPDTPSDSCLVRVSDVDGDPTDVSDAVFKIPLPEITIITPNGGKTGK